MKKITSIYLLLFWASSCVSQNKTSIQAASPEISDNLDLEEVASVFGEVKDLAEFERILNDENEHLSNLDLNNDGYTDYLRVLESIEGDTHVITIQAALGDKMYQDVATIDVDRYDNTPNVQIIGNPYFYGNNYIINPTYYGTPFYTNLFWMSNYSPYTSSYFWLNYPNNYRQWRPWTVNRYINHVHAKPNTRNTYQFTKTRRNVLAINIQKQARRDDYTINKPRGSFEERNKNISNKEDLNKARNLNSPSNRNNNINRQETRQNRTNTPRTSTPRTSPNTSKNTRPNNSGRANSAPKTSPNSGRATRRNK